MSHIWMRHVTNADEPCPIYGWSHAKHVDESWLIHMCVMTHSYVWHDDVYQVMMCIKSWCVSSHDVYQVMMCIKSHPYAYPLPYIPMPPDFRISVRLFTWIYLYAYSLRYVRMPIDLHISLRLFTARYLCAYSLRCIRVPIRYIGMPVDLDISVWLLTAIYADVYMHMPIDLQLDKPSHIYPHLGFRV